MAFGGEMTRLFEDLLEDAGSRRFGVMRLWLRMFADLVASGTHERMEDAMKSHPAMTRAALVVTPIATLIALFAFGGVIALAALTLGLASVGLVWRSLSDAMTPEPQRRWWVMPAIGALLLLAGFGALARRAMAVGKHAWRAWSRARVWFTASIWLPDHATADDGAGIAWPSPRRVFGLPVAKMKAWGSCP